MKIILLGAPGSGKGTQAVKIVEKYFIPHISTGAVFRDNIEKETELGKKVKTVMDEGKLCPDGLTVEIVKDRLAQSDCKKGYLLDGFPRNLYQARALDQFAAPDKVINFEISLDKIERRILGRRVCLKCGVSLHTDQIGSATICPFCGGEIIVRKDDNPETVKRRLAVYSEQTVPVAEYYAAQGKLFNVDCDKDIEDVFKDVIKVLD